MPFEARLTLFIVLCVACALSLAFLFLYEPIKGLFIKRNVTWFYYHKVMKEARNRDYYLVNDILYRLGGSDYVHIDHVLGGDKYIYVIIDEYYVGAVSGKAMDANWVNYPKKGKKVAIENPLIHCKIALERFSKASGINTSFLVGIVLVNDDCFITPIESNRDKPILTPLSRLGKVVAAFEKDDVEPFVGKELERAMIALHDEKEEKKNAKR